MGLDTKQPWGRKKYRIVKATRFEVCLWLQLPRWVTSLARLWWPRDLTTVLLNASIEQPTKNRQKKTTQLIAFLGCFSCGCFKQRNSLAIRLLTRGFHWYWLFIFSTEDMILALTGQFKQLSLEPEKFRWLNGIRTHDLCDAGAVL